MRPCGLSADGSAVSFLDTRWGRAAALIVSLALGAAVWEIAGRLSTPAFLASFSATVARLAELAATGELTDGLAGSLLLFATGFAIAVVTAVPLGLVFARVRGARVAVEPYVMVLYATPMVALIPFILSVMGFGFAPKVLVVVLFAFFPILYNTVEGARSLKPEMVEVARSFRTTERALWLDVLIPYTLPYILTGVRQGIARGLVGMVAAEFFLSASGIGRLIMVAARDFDTAGVFAAILMITGLGVALMAVGRALERRYAAWRGLDR